MSEQVNNTSNNQETHTNASRQTSSPTTPFMSHFSMKRRAEDALEERQQSNGGSPQLNRNTRFAFGTSSSPSTSTPDEPSIHKRARSYVSPLETSSSSSLSYHNNEISQPLAMAMSEDSGDQHEQQLPHDLEKRQQQQQGEGLLDELLLMKEQLHDKGSRQDAMMNESEKNAADLFNYFWSTTRETIRAHQWKTAERIDKLIGQHAELGRLEEEYLHQEQRLSALEEAERILTQPYLAKGRAQ